MIPLVTLLSIVSLLLLLVAVIYWLRLKEARAELEELLERSARTTGVLREALLGLLEHLDESLLPDGSEPGLLRMRVRAREAHDDYATVGELLLKLEELSAKTSLSEREELVKAIYQLQHSLGLSDDVTARILEPELSKLRGTTFLEKEVGRVERVPAGSRVDLGTMWPLSSGTRVSRPLGVVIRDREGGVLSKAKVFCR